MKLNELKEYIQQGREIEFSYKGRPYFMNPIYDKDDKQIGYKIIGYKILDVEKEERIFDGTKEQLLYYEFDPGVSFSNKIEAFDFEYIL